MAMISIVEKRFHEYGQNRYTKIAVIKEMKHLVYEIPDCLKMIKNVMNSGKRGCTVCYSVLARCICNIALQLQILQIEKKQTCKHYQFIIIYYTHTIKFSVSYPAIIKGNENKYHFYILTTLTQITDSTQT